jgi:hypothetical protein
MREREGVQSQWSLNGMMKYGSINMRSKGDSIRGGVGALASLIGISLALSPRLPGEACPQIAVVVVLGLISAICIGTAKSKAGVALGILFIAMFRFLIAGFFYVTGAHGEH